METATVMHARRSGSSTMVVESREEPTESPDHARLRLRNVWARRPDLLATEGDAHRMQHPGMTMRALGLQVAQPRRDRMHLFRNADRIDRMLALLVADMRGLASGEQATLHLAGAACPPRRPAQERQDRPVLLIVRATSCTEGGDGLRKPGNR
jgi:hypothetical protein